MKWQRDKHIVDDSTRQEKMIEFILQEILVTLRELTEYLKLKLGE